MVRSRSKSLVIGSKRPSALAGTSDAKGSGTARGAVGPQITSTAICESDLHLVDGYVPSMMHGDILGHEFMGEVAEVGSQVNKLKIGDRVVPFPVACGVCGVCQKQAHSLCENSNPNAWMAEKLWGHQAPYGYEIFKNKLNNCEKVVLKA